MAPANATVIVRPSGQVVTATAEAVRGTAANSDLDVMVTSAVPSGGGGGAEPAARTAVGGTTASVAPNMDTERGPHELEVEKPCTQASVIVHASAAQSMVLHPSGAMKGTEGGKTEEAGEESREVGLSVPPATTTAPR